MLSETARLGKYLLATLTLATLFLCFKMIEWFVGFEIGDHDHPIFYAPSLLEDKFTIHSSEYTYCHLYDEAAHACTPGYDAIFDIRMSASTFYVTTGTHGVHVFGGMVALAYMVLKAFRGGYTPQNAVSIEYFWPVLALCGLGLGIGLPRILSVLRRHQNG